MRTRDAGRDSRSLLRQTRDLGCAATRHRMGWSPATACLDGCGPLLEYLSGDVLELYWGQMGFVRVSGLGRAGSMVIETGLKAPECDGRSCTGWEDTGLSLSVLLCRPSRHGLESSIVSFFGQCRRVVVFLRPIEVA